MILWLTLAAAASPPGPSADISEGPVTDPSALERVASSERAAAAPSRILLAAAIKSYLDAEPEVAEPALQILLGERPWDDDVAWWLARIWVDAGRYAEAAALLEGRDGWGQPAWRFRALEGIALAGAAEAARAESMLLDAREALPSGPEAREIDAILAALALAGGRDAEAAERLRAAGGAFELTLDAALLEALGAPRVIAVAASPAPGADGPPDGAIVASWGGDRWRIALDTGLGAIDVAPPSDPPPVWSGAEGERSAPDPCRDGAAWTSPREPLVTGQAGVFRWRRGVRGVEKVAATPLGASDDSPACLGDDVWYVRRSAGRSWVAVDGPDGHRALELGESTAVASVDARAGDDGAEILLGLVVDGVPGIWWMPAGGEAPLLLIESPLILAQPRWAE